MRVLLIGSGAREHALLLGLARDSEVTDIHIANGNAGTDAAPAGSHATVTRHSVVETSRSGCVALAQDIQPDLVIIGPEAPLVRGVADALRKAGFNVFGPNKDAARIEGSKAFAKDVMKAAGVRTAHAEIISADSEGVAAPSDAVIDEALDHFGPIWVVKDDGLAAGKGVVVTDDRKKALAHVNEVLDAGNPVLLESYLDGPEISLFCLVDGETVVPLLPAQDHKRAYDNDEGPNTGGMGAYCPLPWLPEGSVERIVKEVCEPVAKEMVKRGCPYSGLLYAGLGQGRPRRGGIQLPLRRPRNAGSTFPPENPAGSATLLGGYRYVGGPATTRVGGRLCGGGCAGGGKLSGGTPQGRHHYGHREAREEAPRSGAACRYSS